MTVCLLYFFRDFNAAGIQKAAHSIHSSAGRFLAIASELHSEIPCAWIRRDARPCGLRATFETTGPAGGRTGMPAPRGVRGKPYFQINSAIAWTTLALTMYADGTSKHQLAGASSFPRHWIYDKDGALVEKSGSIIRRSGVENRSEGIKMSYPGRCRYRGPDRTNQRKFPRCWGSAIHRPISTR